MEALFKKLFNYHAINQYCVAVQLAVFAMSRYSHFKQHGMLDAPFNIFIPVVGLLLTPLIAWYSIPRINKDWSRKSLILQSCSGSCLQAGLGLWLTLALFQKKFQLSYDWYALPILLGIIAVVTFLASRIYKKG